MDTNKKSNKKYGNKRLTELGEEVWIDQRRWGEERGQQAKDTYDTTDQSYKQY